MLDSLHKTRKSTNWPGSSILENQARSRPDMDAGCKNCRIARQTRKQAPILSTLNCLRPKNLMKNFKKHENGQWTYHTKHSKIYTQYQNNSTSRILIYCRSMHNITKCFVVVGQYILITNPYCKPRQISDKYCTSRIFVFQTGESVLSANVGYPRRGTLINFARSSTRT